MNKDILKLQNLSLKIPHLNNNLNGNIIIKTYNFKKL